MNIGIFGGTFNPPHLGHLIVVESVQDQLHFDKILFVPTALPPHKTDITIVSGYQRLEMTQLAIQGNSYFEISDVEIRLGGTSYSVITLNALARQYPKSNFSLIIGADNFLEIEKWKSIDEILNNADIVVMHRPGYSIPELRSKLYRDARFIKVPAIDISSTDIRRRVKMGKSIKYMVPEPVEKYIYNYHLYSQ